MNNDFYENLSLGQRAEAYVASKMLDAGNIFLWPLNAEENKRYHADLCPSVKLNNGMIEATVDVKADTYITSTGNMVFELWSNVLNEPRTAGWGQSKVDYIAVVDASGNRFGGIWLFRMRDVQAYFVTHRKELRELPKDKYNNTNGKKLVQRTMNSYIPLARFAEEYGYRYYPDGNFQNGGEWNGRGTEWNFMAFEDCKYTSSPPYLFMLDDEACLAPACDWWKFETHKRATTTREGMTNRLSKGSQSEKVKER